MVLAYFSAEISLFSIHWKLSIWRYLPKYIMVFNAQSEFSWCNTSKEKHDENSNSIPKINIKMMKMCNDHHNIISLFSLNKYCHLNIIYLRWKLQTKRFQMWWIIFGFLGQLNTTKVFAYLSERKKKSCWIL